MKIINYGISSVEDIIDRIDADIEVVKQTRLSQIVDNTEYDKFHYYYSQDVLIMQMIRSDTKEPYVPEYHYYRTIMRGILHTIFHPDTLTIKLTHRKGVNRLIYIIKDVLNDMGYSINVYDNRNLLFNDTLFSQIIYIQSGKFMLEMGNIIMKHRSDIFEKVLKTPEFIRQQLTCRVPDTNIGETFGMEDPQSLISGLEELDLDFDRVDFLNKLIIKIEEENWI